MTNKSGHILVKIFRSFRMKVSVAFLLAMVFVLLLSNMLIYQFASNAQMKALRHQLMIVAQTSALLIDAPTLMQVPLNPQGVESPAFQNVVAKLNKIRDISPAITYIYTMAKTTQEGIWQFIVDPDQTTKDGPTAYPGDRYDASRFPEMLKAFDGPSADKKLQADEWGVTLSGYAPIYDEEHRAVAILGVDVLADDIYQMRQEVQKRVLIVLAIGFMLALVLGMIMSSHISRPVQELVEGTRRISQGDLKYKVNIQGDSEFSEFAKNFNHMAKSLADSRQRLIGYFYGVVRSLVHILEIRDQYTRGHSEAVAIYAGKIAAKLGYDAQAIKLFKRMTLLHDIGKLGIKDNILNKPGALTKEEWDEMKQHPLIGEKILKPVLTDHEMLSVVRGHHERYDGKGYPDQLKGEQIHMFAAIVCVADAYDAMTSDRAYRKALSKEEAIAELKLHRGTQFHPKVVDAFLEVLKEEPKIRRRK